MDEIEFKPLEVKMFLQIFITLTILLLPAGGLLAQTREEAFTAIYKGKVWGTNANGEGCSGGGSTLETTQVYRQFLQDFFTAYDIHSVVDVGCGDWEFSQAINWDQIDYVGCDIVADVIANNQKRFTASNIHFFHADAVVTELPEADLLICKDVLQHLSNGDVAKFLRHISKYKYCLITNDVNANTLTSSNPPITSGGYRPLDLTAPPFLLIGVKILTFTSGPTIKQTILLINQ